MTDPNKSHITLLVDRSGSMSAIRSDAEGAVNAFIAEQKLLPNPCTLLLVDYDAPSGHLIDVPWFNVIHNGNLADAPKYELHPRGNTALLDAMGQAITMTGDRLKALREDERPGHVFFVVQTDGLENASKDWRLDKLVEAIKDHESTWKWTFIFLGTGPDAFGQSQAFYGTQMVANTVGTQSGGASYAAGMSYTSNNVSKTRSGVENVNYGGKIDDDGEVTESSTVVNQQ